MEERDTVHRVRPERLRLQPMNTSYLLKVSTNFLTESVTKFVTNPIVLTNMLTKKYCKYCKTSSRQRKKTFRLDENVKNKIFITPSRTNQFLK